MARQGHSFATADNARVILRNPDGSVKDVPEDGKTLGEIAVRGNIVMKEVRKDAWFLSKIYLKIRQYFNDPEATAKAFVGGYFATGDLAVTYPDHSISIQDRSKDIIISGGEVCSSIDVNCPPLLIFVVECIKFINRARYVNSTILWPLTLIVYHNRTRRTFTHPRSRRCCTAPSKMGRATSCIYRI